MLRVRFGSLVALLATLFLASVANADIINNPTHQHTGDPAICTYPNAGCTGTATHQHRTAHSPSGFQNESHPGTSPVNGSDTTITGYVAFGTWQNNRTLHQTSFPVPFSHGHVEPENAIRFHVHTAVAGSPVCW